MLLGVDAAQAQFSCPTPEQEFETCHYRCVDGHGLYNSAYVYCSWGCREFDRILGEELPRACVGRSSAFSHLELSDLLVLAHTRCGRETTGLPIDLGYLAEGCTISKELYVNSLIYRVNP